MDIAIKCDGEEVTVTRLNKAFGFNTLSDIVDEAGREELSYPPDVHEVGESLTIKCYTLEDAQKLFKRIKQEVPNNTSMVEEKTDEKQEEEKPKVEVEDEDGPKESLPS